MIVRRLVEDTDADLLQELIEADPEYVHRVTGLPPGPSDGLSLLLMTPPGVDAQDKHVVGLLDGERLAGVVDLVRGYPTAAHAFIGLLQVRPDRRGQGFATALHEHAVAAASSWPGITTLRLAVVDTNRAAAEGFWRRMGYHPTGEVKPYRYASLESSARLWERPLARSGVSRLDE